MVKETELLSSTVERFWSLENYGFLQKNDVSALPLQAHKTKKHSRIPFNLKIIIIVSDYYGKKINQPYRTINR